MNVTGQFNRCELQRVWKTFINGYQHHFYFYSMHDDHTKDNLLPPEYHKRKEKF